eukprot:TRINITY_DN13612_c0_g2_i1.p1 TRINITY_DN13612_c0_g2~~TRINITY_DN13612_c0_g2_i1.p1  ORF type:complete len:123 (+),score=2.85 TRINITY_DN13612_c0_g2_i1:81-449(+)
MTFSDLARILIGYKGKKTLIFKGQGETIPELVSALDDKSIEYALVRVPVSVDGHRTTRDVFINWIGPKVSMIEKGQKNSILAEVMAFMEPFHADLTAISKANFTFQTVVDRSKPLSGSHVID